MRLENNFQIKGFVPVSLVDWPGKIASVVFVGGCNFRCHFCYNPELVLHSDKLPSINEEEIFEYLNKKKNWLDGVVISGGEPTLKKGLLHFCQKVKDLGFLVQIQTNGTNPEMLQKLIQRELVDYIAMDIKEPLEKYESIVGVPIDKEKIQKSIDLIIKNPQIQSEFRTTIVPGLINKEDIEQIGEWIGSGVYYLQQFRPEESLDPKFREIESYLETELQEMLKIAKKYFKKVELRGV